ncbi:MAG: glycosyltransferase family 4 protein [Patescibacteria group bacterium]
MARKKVAIIIKYFYPIKRPSGISSFVYQLAKNLANEVDLTVVSYNKEEDDRTSYNHDGYQIIKVSGLFPVQSARKINKLNPDTVIIFSGIFEPLKTVLYFGLISALIKTKNQVFCQATNYNRENLPAIFGMFLKRFKSVIATNEHLFNQYKKIGKDSIIIPPAVSIADIESLTQVKINKPKDLRIGFVGHFYNIKGPDRLLNTFLKINPSNADIIFSGGDGPEKSAIEQTAKKDARVSIIGWQENLMPYIASCDLLVLPYRDSYSVLGVSQAALEAMALSIPVIGTNTPSLAFLIRDGYNGYIIKDDEDLKQKLEYLLNNPEKRLELGRNARDTIEKEFEINKITKAYLNII